MPLYGGIDLHANNSVIVLLNEQDEVIYRKRLPNDLPTILEQLAPYHTAMEGLVVESTYNWYWLVDGLMEAEYRVHLANPAAMQQYSGLKYTDDDSDARWLAHLLRLGVLPEGYILKIQKQSPRRGATCLVCDMKIKEGQPIIRFFRKCPPWKDIEGRWYMCGSLHKDCVSQVMNAIIDDYEGSH